MATKISATANSVTVVELEEHIDDMLELDMPTLIEGSSGIGKSEIIRQRIEAAGYVMYDRRASQMLPEDFSGIPMGDADRGVTVRCVPDLVAEVARLRETTGKTVTIFLDEVNTCIPQVASSLYEVVHDRRSGNFELPEGTRIIMAGNGAADGANVIELPRPLLNRCSIVHFTGPTYPEWEKWALANNVHPMILTALKVQPDFLHGHYNADEERNPTCRSWARASDALHLLDRTGRGQNMTLCITRLSSYVGDEAALKVRAIFDLATKLYDPMAILTTPKNVGGHADLSLAFLQTMQIANLAANKGHVGNGLTWLEKHHRELLSVYASRVMLRHRQLTPTEQRKGGLIADPDILNRITSYTGTYMDVGTYLK